MKAMNIDIVFARLPLSWKVLVTGFIIVLCSGYFAAVLNAALAVGMSPQAIADHYADKTVSASEAAIIAEQGFVEEEFSFDDELDDMADMDHSQMAMPDMNHDGAVGGDYTLPPQILAQVSHVHLLSFALLLLAMGGLACMTQLSETVKMVVVSLLFIGLWGDIVSLNLVRFVSAGYAYLTFVMGVTIGLCFAFISVRVLWELWLMKPKNSPVKE